LHRLRDGLAAMKFLDPACGCGNFLAIAYREMRDFELTVMKRLSELTGQSQLSLDSTLGLKVSLDQFYGIEIEEWPARIAEVALFLVDHQANLRLAEEFGQAPDRLPISSNAKIVQANALTADWTDVVGVFDASTFIMGNPPFLGSTWQSSDQKAAQSEVWGKLPGAMSLDFVANWFLIAARCISGTGARAGLVSTNSITQGEQPAVIWKQFTALNMRINYAWQTFVWQNAAAGKAAVHCVVIGFSSNEIKGLVPLWRAAGGYSVPSPDMVPNINGYLLAAENILITGRTTPLSPNGPSIVNGSKPADGGFLSNLSPEDADSIRGTDAVAAKYLRRIVGAREFIQDIERWCLWLPDASLSDLRESRILRERISAVKAFRETSPDKQTRQDAARPAEFQKIRQPSGLFIAMPEVTSQSRPYIPIGILDGAEFVPTNKIQTTVADLGVFAQMTSSVFMCWVRSIGGRLKSDYSISAQITLNNFPWLHTAKADTLATAAQGVLSARASHPGASLADLYDPLAMPANLTAAHRALDAVVLAAYGLPADADDTAILARLFDLYTQLVSEGQLDLDRATRPAKRTRAKKT